MSLQGFFFRLGAGRSDRQRDRAIPVPAGVTACRNIRYGDHGRWNRLDVYHLDGAETALPTIVSVHGGGYVYGTKEVYRLYGMDLARRGFACVNFNYRLAPRWHFPTPLEDTNRVMEWICKNHSRYHLDPERIFLVGDSAGAQIASQYAAIATNPEYAAYFTFTVPKIRIRALGLNCGLYEIASLAQPPRKGMALDYLGRYLDEADPRLRVMDAVTNRYPPAHITTACHDFLRENAQPLADILSARGVPCRLECYGGEDMADIGHVFHVNIVSPEAIRCNDDQCAFFQQYL